MTSASILAIVVARTGRSDVITIDTELLYILQDITRRHPFLQSDTTLTYTVSPTALWRYALDTVTGQLCRDVEAIVDTDGLDLERKPNLKKFNAYRGDGTETGEPTVFFVRQRLVTATPTLELWVNPVPDSAYAHTLFFSYIHPVSLTTILLDAEFQDCIVQGVCWKVWEGLGEGGSEGAEFRQNYELELAKMVEKKLPAETGFVQYSEG